MQAGSRILTSMTQAQKVAEDYRALSEEEKREVLALLVTAGDTSDPLVALLETHDQGSDRELLMDAIVERNKDLYKRLA